MFRALLYITTTEKKQKCTSLDKGINRHNFIHPKCHSAKKERKEVNSWDIKDVNEYVVLKEANGMIPFISHSI